MNSTEARAFARAKSGTPLFKDKCILVYHFMHQPNAPHGHRWEVGPIGTCYGFVEAIYRNGELVDEIPLVDLTTI